MPIELMEFLSQTEVTQKKSIIKELKSYKSELDRQKTNFSKKSHNLELPKAPKSIKTLWENVINGLSVYTERIDIVCEVMFKSGKIKSTSIQELLKQNNDELFIEGFGFPNKKIAKLFTEWLDVYGDKLKINSRLSSVDSRIPNLSNILDMDEKSFLSFGDVYDKIFTYGKDDTQISIRNAYEIIKSEFKALKLKKDINISDTYAKSGSIILSISYYLYNNSEKIFGKKLSKKQIIKMMNPKDENIFFNQIISTMGFVKSNNSKKDFIIINPPYKGGLHIDIFNKAFDELEDGGTLICIHPSTPFINRKPTRDDTKTKRIKEIVSEYKTRLTLVDGNKIFNAGFFAPLSITKIEKIKDSKIEVIYSHINSLNKEIKIYNKLDDIFIHGNDIILSIKDKIFSKMTTNVHSYLTRSGFYSNYYVKINSIVGNIPKNGKINPDFNCIIYKDNENLFNESFSDTFQDGDCNYFAVKSKKHGENAFNYFLTKFARICVSLYKTNQHIDRGELLALPYMDFSQEWPDEKLFEYFNLNKDEIKFINEYIPNWYERDFK
jgi:hypothetical protein